MTDRRAALDAIDDVLEDARCWGIELEPRFRVLAVTVEPEPVRAPGTPGEFQLLCYPVSTFLAVLTRPVGDAGAARTALLTFELDQLTAVSERLGGARLAAGPRFGAPEPRPGTWGPRTSLEGRSGAPDGTRTTLTLDLTGDDGARLRLFARFDEAELRDAARTLVLATSDAASRDGGAGTGRGSGEGPADQDEATDPLRF
jgi:hypothetical protein